MSPCECHTQQLTFVFYVRISVWINTTATLIHVPTDVNVIILIAISYMFGKQQKKYTQRTKILELLEATHGHVLLISNLLNIIWHAVLKYKLKYRYQKPPNVKSDGIVGWIDKTFCTCYRNSLFVRNILWNSKSNPTFIARFISRKFKNDILATTCYIEEPFVTSLVQLSTIVIQNMVWKLS